MADRDRSQRQIWDQRHSEATDSGQVAAVLEQNRHLLPDTGKALDLACCRGANALFLAQAGLQVTAWDLSPVAIDRVEHLCRERGVEITAEVRDVVLHPPLPSSFDLILVSYFLERSLAPALIRALSAGGLLFYQTFSRLAVSQCGPSNPLYRLGDNELLRLVQPLRVRCYREDGKLGDVTRGDRDIAMLVAEKVS